MAWTIISPEQANSCLSIYLATGERGKLGDADSNELASWAAAVMSHDLSEGHTGREISAHMRDLLKSGLAAPPRDGEGALARCVADSAKLRAAARNAQ